MIRARKPEPMVSPLVRRLEHGARLSDRDRAALLRLTRNVRGYAPRCVVVLAGIPVPQTLVLLEGWALRCQYIDTGERQITDIFLPGDICHVHAPSGTGPDYSVVALTACRFAHVEPAELVTVEEAHPHIRHALFWSRGQYERILRATLTNNSRRLAEQRIAHLICSVHARLHAVGLSAASSLPWPMTQADVADATGITTVHVARSYKALRGIGLFELRSHHMELADIRRMAAFCGFQPGYLDLAPLSTEPVACREACET